ncbi:1-phosphofructokinase family hexose kinase [Propionibacterium australiense]|uniref:Carbohydrate kinase PfkB n=1 Tax=Propionibacterium australiense TaxID=119981 RepID=A0A383S8E9_9ACTN|nr:PfkB family carbohydrate kinase [Propionibacterium australiense]RLP06676.1 hypothetical protein D7U36_12545 [Propionibacterium australiense]RLP06685.1 hypothetical protein D9T14_11550 [Propionibacterium australiense]SYZ34285.1 Carbohydrate kinase PfkB [Propionibacterium australiense]VEH92178.1 Putative phosphofructokinase pfkB [Propionibacterium australiense]
MARFVTATLNSAIDRIIQIERWTPGTDMRGPAVVECLGGKGMDSAVALTCIGEQVTGVVNVAGPAGDRVTDLGQGYGIDVRPVRVGGSTRESHVVIETATGTMSHITCGTLETTAAGFEEFTRTLRRALDGAVFFIASGSLPKGLGPEAYKQLVDLAGEAGVPALVDCSGHVLVEHATTSNAVVKCNDDEYAEAFALASPSGHGVEAVAADLRDRLPRLSCSAFIVTCGAEGLLVATRDRVVRAIAPRQDAVNAAGAGDSASSAVAWRRALGDDWAETARWTAAVSAAAVLTLRTGELDLDVAKRLLPQVTVTAL